MSILRVANLQFNASGTKRIDYDATNDDGIIKVSADAIRLPVGDTASRPNLQAGVIRYNSDLGLFEGANSTAWGSIGGVVDFSTANGWANSVGVSANSYADAVGAAANSYAETMDTAGNNYTNAVGLAGNNYVNAVVFPAANTKLANATGTLAGSLSTTGTVTSNGYVYVTALDAGNEGGEIQLSGAGNYAGWSLDAWQNNHRTFVRTGSTLANVTYFHALGGSVRMGVNKADPLYTLDVNGTLSTSSRGITQSSMPAGSILQVQQAFYTAATTLASGSFTDYPGLSLTITPTSSTSKFLLMYHLQISLYNTTVMSRFVRNGSAIGVGDAAGSRNQSTTGWLWPTGDTNHQACPMCAWYLDSPATASAITYKVQAKTQSSGTSYINYAASNADNSDWAHRSTSSFTVFEVAV